MDFDFSTLITDRSPSDLELLRDLLSTPMSDWTAEQLAAFNQAASKGAYNYTDLNRVTACMDYLNERLTALGYVTGYQRIVVHPDSGGTTLPEGYTELEYIESTGTQWIDTGVVPGQSDFQIEMDVQPGALTENWFMTINPSMSDQGRAGFLQVGIWSSLFALHLTGIVVDGVDPASMVRKYITLAVSGANASLQVDSVYSVSNPYYQTGSYRNHSVAFMGPPVRCYGMKIFLDGVPARNFVPCKDLSNDIGLYDTENNQFYGNAGTGTFIAGPEITPEPGEVLDPYTWYEMDIPTYPQMQRYITNGKVLRETLALPENTAAMPEDMVGLTQEEANAIEGVLGIIEGWIHNMAAAWFYSGDLYAGEV